MEQIIRSTSPIDANLAASLIREAKSAAFKSRAIGIGAAIGIPGLALSLGAAAMLWADNRQLRSGNVQGRACEHAAPEGRRDREGRWRGQDCRRRDREAADGATVKLADGSVVTVKGTVPAQAQPPIVLPPLKPDENQAIKTSVTVFKNLPHGDGEVVSGWNFASGNAKSPSEQYCYYSQKTGDGKLNQAGHRQGWSYLRHGRSDTDRAGGSLPEMSVVARGLSLRATTRLSAILETGHRS